MEYTNSFCPSKKSHCAIGYTVEVVTSTVYFTAITKHCNTSL